MAETTKPTAQEIEAALIAERRAWVAYFQQHGIQERAGNLLGEDGLMIGEADRLGRIHGRADWALKLLGDRLLAYLNQDAASLALSVCENDTEREAVRAVVAEMAAGTNEAAL